MAEISGWPHGVPKRKYTAVCRATLAGGRVIEELIVEAGLDHRAGPSRLDRVVRAAD